MEGRSASQQEYWQEYWKTDVLLSPCLQAIFPLTLVDGTNTKQKWMPVCTLLASCLPPVSVWPVDEVVALAVAGKMDDAASARPSRRFPASSDLAFSTELELDAVSTLLDPC